MGGGREEKDPDWHCASNHAVAMWAGPILLRVTGVFSAITEAHFVYTVVQRSLAYKNIGISI